MNRDPVSSSNIASIGYDSNNSVLEIEFHSGDVYQYFDVGENVYKELINSDSVGGYLARRIKGVYRYSKV